MTLPRKLTTALAALLCVVATAARSQTMDINSANSLLPYCKAVLLAPGGDVPSAQVGLAMTCLGMFAAMNQLQTELGFCAPHTVPTGQMLRVAVTYAEANPARMHEPLPRLALEALRKAWPCRR